MPHEVISRDLQFPGAADDVRAHITGDYANGLSQLGYKLTDHGRDRVVFVRRFLPVLGLVVGLFTFPIGIIFWVFWRREDALTFTLSEAPEETRVLIAGQGNKETKAWVDSIQA